MGLLHSCSVLTTKMLLTAIVALSFSACTKDLSDPSPNGEDPWKIGEVTLDNYYDYATTRSVQLNINYGRECAGAYFEIYAENPLEVKANQVVKRKDLLHVASGFTDKDGIYNKVASITSSVSKAYIYSPDFGVPTLYVTDIAKNNSINAAITFENDEDLTSMVKSTATRASLSSIKENISYTLGSWNPKSGKPDYLDNTKNVKITDGLRKYITNYFPEGKNNNNTFVTDDADLLVKEKANVWINYFGGSTSAQSVFAYYCYNEKASNDEIRDAAKRACVIFPSAHSKALGDYSGVAVQLKYIDENGTLNVDFPANTKIGFLIWNNGWTNSNGSSFENNVFYSTAFLNKDKRSHTAIFGASDQDKKYNVITMEDWTDSDYNDLAFVVQSNPVKAIELPDPGTPDDENKTDKYRGFLGFEDNWPNKGDYDMNDVIMKYASDIVYNPSNKIVSISDKFTLVWTGANIRNGFAYELPFDISESQVEVLGTNNYSIDPVNNVITLFNDAKSELGVSGIDANDMPNHDVREIAYNITIKFTDPSVAKETVVSPYNPFIIKNKKGDKMTETHLTNFKPSPLANNVFDQSAADISDGRSTFFVCKDGFPFAIHLDARVDESVMNVDFKREGERIDKIYPLFAEWALTRNPSIQWWKK